MYDTIHRHSTTRVICIRTAIYCLIALAVGGHYVDGDEASVATDDAVALQPFVSETTVFVMKLDPARVALPELTDQFASMSPEMRDAWQRWTVQAKSRLEWLHATTDGQMVYATVGIPISKRQWPVVFFQKPTPETNADTLRERLHLSQPFQTCVRGEYVVVTPVEGADVEQTLDRSPPTPRAELAAALTAVSSYPLQVLLLPPGYARRTVQELLPQLPPQLGGGPSTLLTDGLSWAALGIDPASLRAELVVQSESEEAAQKLAEYLPTLLQCVCDASDSVPGLQQHISSEAAKLLIGLVKPQVSGSRITVHTDGMEQIAETVRLLQMAADSVQQTIRRQSDSSRFKQIFLAMHNYHDTFRSFPPRQELRDEKGNSKLSWRVHILPFVEEGALYKEFHLDEAWDSPHNKALLEKMPDVYKTRSFEIQPGREIKPGHTTFLAPVGDGTVFGGPKATTYRDIRDGTSNTVVLVEVKPERAVPWTAPDDFVFDPNAPANGLQIGADGRFLAALADGSVLELRGDLTAAQLLQLFLMSDGQVIDWQQSK